MNKTKILLSLDLQKEQMQEDVLSILEGLDQQYIDNVCQVIVDRMNILKTDIKSFS